MLINFLQVS
jgi:hypothetical protein